MKSQLALVLTAAASACLAHTALAQHNPYRSSNPDTAYRDYAAILGYPSAASQPSHGGQALPLTRALGQIQPVKHVGEPVAAPGDTTPAKPVVAQVAQFEPTPGPTPGPTPVDANNLVPEAPFSPFEPYNGNPGWNAGAGFYWIQPNFENNTAYRLHRRVGPDNLANDYVNFRHDMGIAPLVWIGYEGPAGFGIRARWFHFEQDAYESIVKDDSFIRVFHAKPLDLNVDFGTRRGSLFEFYSDLNIDVWSLEGTKSFRGFGWSFLLGAGVQYAHMSQNYTAYGPRSDTDLGIYSGHNFNGAGPTFCMELMRGVGCSGFSLYGNARASVLFGTAKQTAYEEVTDRATGRIEHSTLNYVQQADVLPIGELEIGVEYGRNFGGMRAFMQVGFVGQVWFGAGNAANVVVTAEAADNTNNLGFVGAAFRFGLDF